MSNKQALQHFEFLITSQVENPPVKAVGQYRIGEYLLVTGTPPAIEFSEDSRFGAVLLGEAFDWENPERDNREICRDLLLRIGRGEVDLGLMDHLTGRFLLITLKEGLVEIHGDATGRFELYYDEGFNHMASSVSLLSKVVHGISHPESIRQIFDKPQDAWIPVFTATWFRNIYHLLPNHKLNLKLKKKVRYFPSETASIIPVGFEDGVNASVAILKGVAKAMANRHDISLPLTAGYDSRLLYAMFLPYNPRVYILKHPGMKDSHYDLKTAREISSLKNTRLDELSYESSIGEDVKMNYELGQCREEMKAYFVNGLAKVDRGGLFLNGNNGEIGRSYYGRADRINGNLLAALLGYPRNDFVESAAKSWLAGFEHEKIGEKNMLDFFYWEVHMGNWGAKAMSEANMFVNMTSPFNNHRLFRLWMSLPKKHRRHYRNDLFRTMIGHFDRDLLPIPFNPNRKTGFIKLMIDLGIYDGYKNWQNSKLANT